MLAEERKTTGIANVIDFTAEIKRHNSDRPSVIEQLNTATDQKSKKQIEKKLAALDARLANLKAISHLSVGDWVTNRKLVGKIAELKSSPGGMPECWVDWCDGIPAVPEMPVRLSKLPENFHCGFEIGDRVIEKDIPFTLVGYAWRNSAAVPVVDDGNCRRTSDFELLTSSKGFIVEFLSRDPEPITVHLDLAEVRDDGGTQARVKLDLTHVSRLVEQMEGGVELDPVDVFYDNECYWLADGFHRLAAHKESKSPTIAAKLHHGTLRDAILYAVGANADHKPVLPRTRADKRNAVTMLLNDPEWNQWSDSEIGKACKVDHKTVASYRKSILGNSQDRFSQSYLGNSQDSQPRKVIRNGKTYTMETNNIGRSAKGLQEMFEEEDQSTTVVIADNGIHDGKTGEIVDYPNSTLAIVEVEGKRETFPLRSLNGENGKPIRVDKLPPIVPPSVPDKTNEEVALAFISRIEELEPDLFKAVYAAMIERRKDGRKLVSEVERLKNEELFGLR
ncbi:MAG: hypothetical protein ACRCZS_23785 [Chroococcidiopsis sp.]